MDAELTKSFAFSASYSDGSRAIGRNFTLHLTTRPCDAAEELEMERTVEHELLSKVHSRDLSQVDFLKDVERTDLSLLRAFWKRLAAPLAPYHPKRIALQRDARNVTSLSL